MTVLPILTYPDRFLTRPVQPVTKINDGLQEAIENMAETMYDASGVGLAAIQAGIDKSVIVYDPEADAQQRSFRVIINPRIVESHGSVVSEEEGCLSVPEMRCDIRRAERIIVEGLDRNGTSIRFESDGMEAIILQHEIDHLCGRLILDHISALKRQMYKRKRLKTVKNE